MQHIYKDQNKKDHGNLFIKNLSHDEEMYRQFFKLNKKQMDFVVSLIGNNIKKETSSRRVKYPISPVRKLFLILKQVNFYVVYVVMLY